MTFNAMPVMTCRNPGHRGAVPASPSEGGKRRDVHLHRPGVQPVRYPPLFQLRLESGGGSPYALQGRTNSGPSNRPAKSGERRMATLQGKTLFITGATRGIGHAIGVRAAQDGANIVVAAKTTEPPPQTAGHDLQRG